MATDLKGVLLTDVVLHRQHRYVKAGQENTPEDNFLLLICGNKETATQLLGEPPDTQNGQSATRKANQHSEQLIRTQNNQSEFRTANR